MSNFVSQISKCDADFVKSFVDFVNGKMSSKNDTQAVGAHVLPTIEDIYATAEMIVKVKEPIVTEYNLIRKGQLLFTLSLIHI